MQHLHGIGAGGVGLEFTEDGAALCVDGVQPAVVVAGVEHAAGQGGGGEHVRLHVPVEFQTARLRVECHEAGAVGRADVHHAIGHGGGADDPRLACRVVPDL